MERILVVGGYGKVGAQIAARLAARYPGRICIGGRNGARAEAAARTAGNGAVGRAIDLASADPGVFLEGISLAVVCVDQADTRFASQCLSRGIHYVDVTADDRFLSAVELLDETARDQRATALLSVGVAPGLTNLLAVRAQDALATTERIDLLVDVGFGDDHGAAALGWILENLDAPYEVLENGEKKNVRSFGDSLRFDLPGEPRPSAMYRFNFSDQHVLARTLDVGSVSTWIRFGSGLSTWLLAQASRRGLGTVLRRQPWRAAAVALLQRTATGSNRCRVAARATGTDASGAPRSAEIAIAGRREARMTAVVASECVRQVLRGGPPPGVVHIHQGVDLDCVITALKIDDPKVVAALSPKAARGVEP